MSRRRRSWSVAVLTVVLALVAVTGTVVALTGREPPTATEQTRAVASTLRCPSCLGEHVADSTSPVAESMRLVVAEQLAAGRSPDQVRAWFADAYGDEVLLEPPRRGAGWTLWVVPLVVVGAAAVWFARRRSRRALGTTATAIGVALLGAWWLAPGLLPASTGASAAGSSPTSASPTGTTTERTGTAVSVLQDAVADQPGRVELRAALAHQLDEAGRTDAAVPHWAAAVRLRPMDSDLRYRYAFALTRTGSPGQAVPVLEETLAIDAHHAPTLLLLGSSIEESDPERSAALLVRYRATRAEDPEEQP
ncbi:Cytochrome c-type biogenesis protein CcmH/NrfF [Promicromonospora umidemergens]|uniref:Cytochrome c-type biogenesis protein n=1 Tax=Promicromonospora umidemergens TaxID=629679 RepID=A0ABP8YCW5_9MICO|nr:cytochrome c-type biogenesis protein CcmH [Promicromonospora umidemergens]MCP2286706.1 Cytochrome c-type biogenesis protein CcmH/NrfF [Promicromonospora umidemergens]